VFHVKHDDLRAAADRIGVVLDDGAADRLIAFEQLLVDRAATLGFVAAGDAHVMRERHVLDCLRAAPLLAGRVVDLGSGAGLPGIVVAIARQDLMVDLAEPQRRRLAFLELAVERLGLSNATPLGRNAQALDGGYDRALARAFADARRSWGVAERLVVPGGSLVYFAGTGMSDDLGDLAARIEIVPPPPLLASAGPLVIMTRQ
jgi:16S rRNA (guanine527-N7)-methyltransferase